MKKIKLHRYFFYGCLVAVGAVVRLLPLRAASAFGALAGRLAYWILPHERHKALTHLKWVFEKEKTQTEIYQMARDNFANLGRNLGEWLKMPALSDEEIRARVVPENFDRIKKALQKGKGAILLTGHFGNWEWLAAYVSSLGYRGVVLARKIHFEPYNRLLVRLRRSHGVETFFRNKSPKPILKELAQNHLLGILPDQDVDKINGIFIPFLGREAYTPTAPVAIARASGAALIPVFLVRNGQKFHLRVEEPIPVERSQNKEADLYRHTLEWNSVLERYVRQYPDHWVWMHRRWRTRPQSASGNVYEKQMA